MDVFEDMEIHQPKHNAKSKATDNSLEEAV